MFSTSVEVAGAECRAPADKAEFACEYELFDDVRAGQRQTTIPHETDQWVLLQTLPELRQPTARSRQGRLKSISNRS